MNRLRQRLERLGAEVTPQKRISLAFRPMSGSAPFKAENGVGPHDTIVPVILTFDA